MLRDAPSRALLSMREVFDGINGIPHSEEAAQRLSRRTHSADPADPNPSPSQGEQWVTVLPVTHAPSTNRELVVEIPATTKRRLGLDDARSWVVLSEANRFLWPGPDLSPARQGDTRTVAYGQLPYALFEEIRQKFIAAIRARRAGVVPRSE
jgi:hypothetical protein